MIESLLTSGTGDLEVVIFHIFFAGLVVVFPDRHGVGTLWSTEITKHHPTAAAGLTGDHPVGTAECQEWPVC